MSAGAAPAVVLLVSAGMTLLGIGASPGAAAAFFFTLAALLVMPLLGLDGRNATADGGPVSEPSIQLRALSEDDVPSVLAAAVAGALPRDVMPPDDDPDAESWTDRRVTGLARFLRSRLSGLDDGRREWAYVVGVDGQTMGVARLLPDVTTEAMEVGLWLADDARGRGVGRKVLALLMEAAREHGAVELVADTTTGNTPALAMLRRAGAVLTRSAEHPGTVDARLRLNDR